MSAHEVSAHPTAPAVGRVLYHVVHPADMDQDQWTQDYEQALAMCARFIRDYRGVHLHAFTLHAGQYDGECLLRTDTEAAA